MSVDPGHQIELWTKSFKIPRWVDKKDYMNCRQCKKKFTRSHQHHCRLCGHMFCSVCTGKYHVPKALKVKDKSGPTRVCFGCVEKALIERERKSKDVLNQRKVQLNITIDRDILIIHPPLMTLDPSEFYSCGLCGLKTSKSSLNCSACGDVMCDDCLTNDVRVPKDFPLPPGSHSHKLCRSCRFITFSGASFINEPPAHDATYAGIKAAAQKRAIEEAKESMVESESSINETSRSFVSPKSPKSSRTLTSSHRSLVLQNASLFRQTLANITIYETNNVVTPKRNHDSFSASFKASRDVIGIHIRWWGSEVDIAIIDVVLEETLLSVYSKLVAALPALKDVWVCFVYNGLPICPEHWDLIPARYFEPILCLKQGIYDFHKRFATGKIAIASHDYENDELESSNVLSIKKGELIAVLKSDTSEGWWYGYNLASNKNGWFPHNRIRLASEAEG